MWHFSGHKYRCNGLMGTKSREVIWGGQVMGAEITAKSAREAATKAAREADRAECHAWSLRMEGFGGPAQPFPTIGQCLNGRLSWLEVECHRCETRASLRLDAIRRPRDTPNLEAGSLAEMQELPEGPVCAPRSIRLTETRQIAAYLWVHPDEER